jgi:hypothetical protein
MNTLFKTYLLFFICKHFFIQRKGVGINRMIASLFGSSSKALPPLPIKSDSNINKIPKLVISSSPAPVSLPINKTIAVVREALGTEASENTWVDDACIERYLRATSGDPAAAVTRLENTLRWRHQFDPNGFNEEEAKAECAMGRVYLNGFTKDGHPIMYMICRRNGSADHLRGLRWSIFLLEKAIASMPAGIERYSLCMYF